jgi:diacylglycerol kinase family enzyme
LIRTGSLRGVLVGPTPGGSMRALMVFNPNATTVDHEVRDVIAAALTSQVDIEVHPTKQRGHATHLAAGAVHDEVDVVFAFGGDGTANEVIQGLAGSEVLLGIIPGGGANVLARSLGLPNDAIAATSVLLQALREGRSRTIGLGRAGPRYFGFNAGFGFDAAVVRHVEQRTRMKRALRQVAFVWSATREWAAGSGRDGPQVTIHLDDGRQVGPVAISMIANTRPYTYLGERPMDLHPQASFETGLDLLTVGDVGTIDVARIAWRTFGAGSHLDLDGVTYHHDLPGFSVSSPTPLPVMVDGDYAGEYRELRFVAVPHALKVLA